MQITVHPGIGDISWVLSKISTTGEKFDLVIANDRKTRRAMPLIGLVDCVRTAQYSTRNGDYKLLAGCGNAYWADYVEAGALGRRLYVTANTWLEHSNRLEGFLPDLDTDFHYKLNTTEQDARWAEAAITGTCKTMGVYISASRGIQAWEAWGAYEWAEFITKVRWKYPHTTFVLFGASWDQDMRQPIRDLLDAARIDYRDFIGHSTLGQSIELLKRLDYHAGFASGMQVLANVVYKPCLMLYPEHLDGLRNSWACPVSIANGDYVGLVWDRPGTIMKRVKRQLDKYLGQ